MRRDTVDRNFRNFGAKKKGNSIGANKLGAIFYDHSIAYILIYLPISHINKKMFHDLCS